MSTTIDPLAPAPATVPRWSAGSLWLACGGVSAVAAIVAVVASGHAGDALRSPLDLQEGWDRVWTFALLVAFAAYLGGLAGLHRRTAPIAAVAAIAAVIQLAPLASPLLLSRDTYVYWDYARIAQVHGANPYTALPERWPSDPAYARMGADWHRTYDAYGPAWTLIAQGEAAIAGESSHVFARLSKIVGAIGALALVAAVGWAAPRPRRAFAVALVGWNPLLALHFAGGGHNDALMMALAVAAIGLGVRRREVAAGGVWAWGVAVKWLPLILIPFDLLQARSRARVRLLVGCAVGAVTVAAVASAFYGIGWLRAVVPISNQLQRTSSLSTVYWLARLGISERHTTIAVTVLFVIAYAGLLVAAWRGRMRRALAAGLLCLSVSWLTPWYAAWPLALAAVEVDAAGTGLALVLSAWLLWDALPTGLHP